MAYLVGASRKRVTKNTLGGTLAAHALAQLGGATILRVHDVPETCDCVEFLESCGNCLTISPEEGKIDGAN
jgi:dihydropteroate synthase